jgi:hypothetical protein
MPCTCALCDEAATTTDGLCDECFNDMMDARHADYMHWLAVAQYY